MTEPWQFFWAGGGLSSVLDNAPTYLCMTAIAAGQLGVPSDDPQFLSALLAADGGAAYLAAVSCGAVFMGCLTYLGNGPNLMVKEIAEDRGIAMPNFVVYAAAATLIMIPIFVGATFIFFYPT
jgi:Na+/H+ antiporter NhaD/arsenite permease-like protein